jgi:hypothetical protein
MLQTTPEWAELLQTAIDSALLDVHTSMPGQVTHVYTDAPELGQLVDVRPSLRHALATDADPDAAVPYVEEDLPILQRVPVAYPQGGGYCITWPLAVGDFVLLIFSERSIRHWLATAIKTHQVTSSCQDVDAHTLDGAVALPLGPAPLNNLLAHAASSSLVLGSDAASGKRIYIYGNIIYLGTDDITKLSKAARADQTDSGLTKIHADLVALKTAISTALEACQPVAGAPVPPQGVFDAAAVALPSTYPATGSSVVYVEK